MRRLSPPEYERLYRAAKCMLCTSERHALLQATPRRVPARAVVRVSPQRLFEDFVTAVSRRLVAVPPYTPAQLLSMGPEKAAALICIRLMCSQARKRRRWAVAQLWEDWCLSHAPFKLDEELREEHAALFGRLRKPSPALLDMLTRMSDEELRKLVSSLERDLPYIRARKVYVYVSPEAFFEDFKGAVAKGYVALPGLTKEQLLKLGPQKAAKWICAAMPYAENRGHYRQWKLWCAKFLGWGGNEGQK